MSGWRVVADPDLCQGHQMCRLDAPEVFGFDKAADTVVVRRDAPDDELLTSVRTAVANCPAMALSLLETERET
ncbi:ferredoxin [Cryptosporangium japonicum]|uniref:Ferredoxin n=1 Tax=Cryptosporangium japonicum TaxID=80872 RepID=A0ABN0UFW2_9ACTN